ncbi:protein kinase [Pseudomonas asiatica]|uniref:protein kinase domain-containing protein n=1 Tax=Pseudomonas asiatica TaxID=2219225 RepID=UPI002E7B079C|nr:protein kinase [Pseudomonas asiatica]MEE1916514.1 protein kinase [Pseudomonas asiatica]
MRRNEGGSLPSVMAICELVAKIGCGQAEPYRCLRELGMPDLSQEKIGELQQTLQRYLEQKGKSSEVFFLAAGGSAAVFKSGDGEAKRAFKVFDPRFISDEEGSKEQERLGLQRRLINHDCEYLVQTFAIENFENTAVIEMEFVEWPRLKEVLKEVPDDAVETLIRQLVNAVRYLEGHGIVHRDIKPENIHVSECWKKLKLLDLGVVREFDPGPGAAETDQGAQRPFLATAQYSSPEYLFRLDEPSRELWQGLNIYQVGAVLHDLIMKEPLFRAEMDAGNRWLVAKAVLLHSPSFVDGNPTRLGYLKVLAAKCLNKDLQSRLALVSWLDFEVQEHNAGLNSLRLRLKARPSNQTDTERTLNFERSQYLQDLIDKVRIRLISACGTDLPLSLSRGKVEGIDVATFLFSYNPRINVIAHVFFDWKIGLYAKSVDFLGSATIQQSDIEASASLATAKLIGTASMDGSIEDFSNYIAESLARLVEVGLHEVDLVESVAGPIDSLFGKPLELNKVRDEQ